MGHIVNFSQVEISHQHMTVKYIKDFLILKLGVIMHMIMQLKTTTQRIILAQKIFLNRCANNA
jgi:hypothetical protein